MTPAALADDLTAVALARVPDVARADHGIPGVWILFNGDGTVWGVGPTVEACARRAAVAAVRAALTLTTADLEPGEDRAGFAREIVARLVGAFVATDDPATVRACWRDVDREADRDGDPLPLTWPPVRLVVVQPPAPVLAPREPDARDLALSAFVGLACNVADSNDPGPVARAVLDVLDAHGVNVSDRARGLVGRLSTGEA